MNVFLDSCGVKHMRTALYNPRAHGIVERANRMIKGGIQLAVVNGLDIELVISDMVWAHRSTENLVSGRVPFEIMRGRKPVDWSGKNELSSDDCSGYMLKRDEDAVGPCRYQVGERVQGGGGNGGCYECYGYIFLWYEGKDS
ncbi:hypothetical protein NDU88_008330 [Pleurodeles waltl]|uniref:Integrase catalytic domain-containing protein n=1 Tax=Pleurodeles waltl TaxID=8319 RepID=A0AAV7RS08_PLEWA|nr:hypothetical protein NDU88_008330 [Pleurodeles waltl]